MGMRRLPVRLDPQNRQGNRDVHHDPEGEWWDMKRMNFSGRKIQRREEAEKRQKAYEALSPEEKLKTIRGRRQRKRLLGK